MRLPPWLAEMAGFGLIEMMLSLFILAFGLLAAGQLLYIAACSSSVTRSKDTAVLAAQSELESLAALFHGNPSAEDLLPGAHGPRWAEIANPLDGTVLNRYELRWTVERVEDPRPGRKTDAWRVQVTATPARLDGVSNSRPSLNKTARIGTVISPRSRG